MSYSAVALAVHWQGASWTKYFFSDRYWWLKAIPSHEVIALQETIVAYFCAYRTKKMVDLGCSDFPTILQIFGSAKQTCTIALSTFHHVIRRCFTALPKDSVTTQRSSKWQSDTRALHLGAHTSFWLMGFEFGKCERFLLLPRLSSHIQSKSL